MKRGYGVDIHAFGLQVQEQRHGSARDPNDDAVG
jgi:hypothetical protein